MASPKSGKAASAVAPEAPTAAHDADSADPGEVSKAKAEALTRPNSKYAPTKVKPFKPAQPAGTGDPGEEPTWIEIVLKDEDGNVIPGEPFEIEMPDGSVHSGTLDQDGFARVDGIEPGTCKVHFPERCNDAWAKG